MQSNNIVKIENSTCSACGSEIARDSARFCNVCGKLLFEEYQPLDNLRASYNLQGKSFEFQQKLPEETLLFEQNKNQMSETAWACLVYSMVPYLGILFVPFTFLIGGFGYANAIRQPQIGGKKLAITSIYLSFAVLAIQLFLWWLLYFIPQIGKQI